MRENRQSDQAQVLTVRLITGGIALAAGIKFLYFLPLILAQYPVVPRGPFVFGLVGEFAIPLLGGVLAFGAGLRTLWWVNAGTVVGHVVVTALSLVLFATTDNALTPPWIFIPAGAAAAAAVCWGSRGVFVLLTLAIVSVGELPSTVFAGTNIHYTLSGGIQMVVGMAVFGGLALAVVSSGRELDSVAGEAAAAVAMTSSRRARQATSVHTDAIMHDDILGTLLFGAENNPLLRTAVAIQATRALGEIKKLSAIPEWIIGTDIEAFVAEASEIVHELDPRARIISTVSAGPVIPGSVAVALVGSLTQALTNSILHAGVAQRVVTFASSPSGCEIRVEDDGVGFDPVHVPRSRLGISSSIHGRMRGVPGGSSAVESAPGHGTIVDLRWHLSRESSGNTREVRVSREFTPASRPVEVAVAVTFLVGQVLLCVLSSISSGNPVGSIVAMLALCVPIVVLMRERFVMNSTAVAAAAVGVLIAASTVFFQGIDVTGVHAGVWFVDSGAVVLMVLLHSRHGRLAWAVMGAVLCIVLADSVTQGSSLAAGLELVVRPIAILLAATFLSVPLNLLQPRIDALRAKSRRLLDEQTFRATSIIQRQSEAVRLQSLAGPLLETLARAEELSGAQVAECIALEGLLRDQARGNRLSRGELSVAASRARQTGIDVMLLDDSDGEGVTATDILDITAWMSGHLSEMAEGQFVGRILPAGRSELATIVMTDSAGPSIMSFARR